MTTTRTAPRQTPSEPVDRFRPLELTKPHLRIGWFRFAFAFMMTIFAAQLVNIQVIQHGKLSIAADNGRLQSSVQPALRGMITDIHGVPLATTVIARNVTVNQTQVKDAHGTAKKLAPLLNLSVSTIEDRITGSKEFNFVAKKITPELAKKVVALNLPGIYLDPTTTRLYPAGSLAASLVGYVGSEGHGLGGLEYSQDKYLAGVDGKQTIERVNGAEIPTTERNSVDAVNGTSVRLTIDRDLQALAERTLGDRIKQAGGDGGDVIVMDPKTGNILAMATYPVFDPNNPSQTDDHAKRNDAVSDAFEPGSTSKVMTIAAVLEEGAADPTTPFTIKSVIKRGGTTFHDHDPHGTIHLTLNGILAKSSNIGAIQASELIGRDKFLSYLDKFGIGHATGLHFPGESPGIINKPGSDAWSDTSFPTYAFGQGISVTALQVASVYATIANDGVRMTPRLIDGYVDPSGNYSASDPSQGVRVISATTAKTVREMLEGVVSKDGTAPAAQIPGYRVAGKTGTANRFSDTTHGYSGYTASFVGFAPAENPSLVIAVMIHNPVNGHFGSTVSAPVFREVMMYALAQQKIPPSTTKPQPFPVTW